ncbi:MAG TPA: sulfite exporter TauE/SafE family protein [Chthonomonadales bacterium]|nr:sulfite exporter TauE/SafE family protein [Chthonomonadales bacterium]
MEQDFALIVLVGFAAQMVDGALGMAYGVTSTTFLLSMGIPPAAASASVKAAEVVTTAISGTSHLRLGNVRSALLRKLLIPGMVGSALGAYILTAVPGDVIKPIVSAYLALMGAVILWKAFSRIAEREVTTAVAPLGFVGGFCDAIGGGGWGPIVTTTLVARGNHARFTIGTVNLAEFFVTLVASVTFVLTIGLVHWQVILGLMLGGAVAAPLAARVCRRVPSRPLMVLVGVLITVISMRTLILELV